MRNLRGPIAIVCLGLALTACHNGSDTASASELALEKKADLYAIGQIERRWHQASSTHDVDLMMSLWADDATFTVGGETYTGKDQIRHFFSDEAAPFQKGNHWISDSPAYKQRVTVNGDTGTLYFECDYIDVDTEQVVAVVSADQDVALIDGSWLIITSVAASPELTAGY